MKKPLELTIYPLVGSVYLDEAAQCVRSCSMVDGLANEKRLTEPELAAEYYRSSFLHENSLSENDGYDGMPETREHRRQAATFYRFAILPHYDEAPAG